MRATGEGAHQHLGDGVAGVEPCDREGGVRAVARPGADDLGRGTRGVGQPDVRDMESVRIQTRGHLDPVAADPALRRALARVPVDPDVHGIGVRHGRRRRRDRRCERLRPVPWRRAANDLSQAQVFRGDAEIAQGDGLAHAGGRDLERGGAGGGLWRALEGAFG